MKKNLPQSLYQSYFLHAALLGVLAALAFPPINFWPILFVVFIPMLRRAAGEKTAGKAFRLGFVFAFLFFFCTLHWLIPTMQTFGPLPLPAAFGALALFAVYLALYPALFFVLVQKFHQKKAPLILLLPASWIGLELLRSFLFSGFPWAQIGHGLVSAPLLIQTADLGGVYLLSFGIVTVNTALAFYSSKKSAVIFACAFWLLSISYGFYRMEEVEKKSEEAKTLSVSILQGSIPPREKWEPAFQRNALATYQKLVAESPKDGNRLFLWPETALPFFLFEAKTATKLVLDMIDESQSSHLVGSLAYAEDGNSLLNASFLINPRGAIIGKYSKSHLVPFGEYVPLRKQLPFLSAISGIQTEFSRGNAIPALSQGDLTVGSLICFESVFPEYSRKA
ncbi:apolipoprotein N-acyltransferase, partial [Desulfococcaceae bacterium OttesenSCG-928-F15]|nr:apolipoprotein N-acyltransferase [Desulfococcaceae bacterium OttesenSCG-928-F15]